MESTPRPALERALLEKLQAILADTRWPAKVRLLAPREGDGGWRPDAIALLRTRTGLRLELWVEAKRDLRPGAFGSWAQSRRPKASSGVAIPVLAVPSISERLADLCRRAGWSWYDLAGNCRIEVPGLLHIERRGNPPAYRPPRAVANLGTPAAARVLRALLTPAHAGRTWSHRDLLQQTHWPQIPSDHPVSIGLINKVLHHLRDEGYVEVADGRGIRLRDPKGLLNAWTKAYRFDRHERRSYFTLLKGAKLERALFGTATVGMAVYAAFSAAERQAPHVRQPKTWVYVTTHCLDQLVQSTEAKAVDSGENLVVLIPDDVGVFVSFDGDVPIGERRLHSTDPVQTYVDLRHCGGRGEEAAQALLEQRLLPAWKAARLA